MFLPKPGTPPDLLATVEAATQAYQSRAVERSALPHNVEHQLLRLDPLTRLATRLQLTETADPGLLVC